MKVLIVSDVDVESGRGPVTRLASVLEGLARRTEVVLVALGPVDGVCREAIERSGCRVHPARAQWAGWSLRNLPEVLDAVEQVVAEEAPDLVVLYREIWDLIRGLSDRCARIGVPFLLMPHSMPFLDAVARPSGSFLADFARHLARERRPHALKYMITHVHQYRIMRTMPRIAINETVEAYLDNYFPRARTVRALPGYATEPIPVSDGEKLYDLAFMAKLSEPKGIFETIGVLRRVRRTLPDARMLMIGSFEDERVERDFTAQVAAAGLSDAVELAGWLTGPEKYRALGTARVFCYPSISADTFSLCLLEALSCGLPAVCYDVPFVRAVYRTQAVRRVPLRDGDAMADEITALLSSGRDAELARCARGFAGGYASWDAVAEAEYRAYREFLGARGGTGADPSGPAGRITAVTVLGRGTTEAGAREAFRALEHAAGLDLVVVDDGVGSAAAQVLADRAPGQVRIVSHVRARGRRDAFLSGLRHAGAHHAVLFDAGPGSDPAQWPDPEREPGPERWSEPTVIARNRGWRSDPSAVLGLAGSRAELTRMLGNARRDTDIRGLIRHTERLGARLATHVVAESARPRATSDPTPTSRSDEHV